MADVIELTAADVATLSAAELEARGLSEAAVQWVLHNREAGAVRFDPQTQTITPVTVLENRQS